MKKFTFRLASLKRYREQVLDAEKITLGEIRADVARLYNELADIIADIAHREEVFSEMLTIGTTSLQISTHRRYISQRRSDRAKKQVEIVQKEAMAEAQLQVVIEATKDLSTVEKLEEHQLEEYRMAELKENELFIDEFVSNAQSRKISGF